MLSLLRATSHTARKLAQSLVGGDVQTPESDLNRLERRFRPVGSVPGWLTRSMWPHKPLIRVFGAGKHRSSIRRGRQASVEFLQFGQDILVNVISFGLGVDWLVCLEGGMR